MSCSMACLAVAFSMTCSSTDNWLLSVGFESCPSFSSVSLVCCRIAILVSSGIPGMSFSAIALRSAVECSQHPRHSLQHADINLLDFPVPLRPTKAYRCPSFSRSLAAERISTPSLFPLPFPLAVDLSPEVTVMFTPSISSCVA